jgi:hypothetical protein
MRDFSYLRTPTVFIDIGASRLRLSGPNGAVELPLERGVDGKITAACRQQSVMVLAKAADRKSWQLKTRAVCALSAAGILLRKVTLPAVTKEELPSVLHLQLEREFPLAPEELAWGWNEVSANRVKREVLLAAVRKETVEDYAAMLAEAGFQPEFTLAGLARNVLCPTVKGDYGILDVESAQAELISFEDAAPSSLRLFPTKTLNGDVILKKTPARILYVSGTDAVVPKLVEQLRAQVDCRRLEIPGGEGDSSALAGLKKALADKKPLLLLGVQPKMSKAVWNVSLGAHRQNLTKVAILLVILMLFPFAESLLLKPVVGWKLASFKKHKLQFDSVVAPELNFFLYLKQNQPPYLDTLYVLAKASPPGMHISSITLDQLGDISLKLDVQNPQQMMDFRGKLIDSGFFSNVSLEEQTPVPGQGQPKLNVRMSLRWKPAGQRPLIKMDPAPVAADAANPAAGLPKM